MRPEISLGVALAVSTAVVAIHQVATPSMADMRTLDPNNSDIDAAERAATWMSAGLVATVSLVAKDPVIFIFGGLVTVGLAWFSRHSNNVKPGLSMIATPTTSAAGSANSPEAMPAPAVTAMFDSAPNDFVR